METKNENNEVTVLTRRILVEEYSKTLHVYTRTAVDNINGDSIKLQKQLGEEASARLGLIPKYYEEVVVAGNVAEINQRPALENLLNEVAKGRVKCLYVRDISRLSRNVVAADTILKLLKENNVIIYTEAGIYNYQHLETKEFITNIIDLFERHQKESHSRKIKAALENKRNRQINN